MRFLFEYILISIIYSNTNLKYIHNIIRSTLVYSTIAYNNNASRLTAIMSGGRKSTRDTEERRLNRTNQVSAS